MKIRRTPSKAKAKKRAPAKSAPSLLSRMPRRPSLFWDVDPKKVDPKKNARYVIARIMDFGTDAEVRWMWQAYPKSLLRTVADRSRGLHSQSRALWKTLTK